MSRRLLIAAGIVAIGVFVTYLPCLDAEFVDWDDDKNIIENPRFRGLWPGNLLWMFTTTHMGPYQPLSWLTLGIDYTLWGLNPRGYHLTNVLLHAAGAAVMCLVTASILMICRACAIGDRDGGPGAESGDRSVPPVGVVLASVVAALTWALHPQHVESVAWVTERRDVLSGLFYLLCVFSYLQAHRTGLVETARHRWERVAVVCCVLALLSKAIAVSLPVVLVVLDIYPLRRLQGRPWMWLRRPCRHVLLEKFNYVLFAALAVVVGFVGQARTGAVRSLDQVGLIERPAIAAHAVVFYVGKTVWPADLAPLYPRPEMIRVTDPRFLYAVLGVVIVSVAMILLRRRWPAGLAVWACYVGALLPVSGLITIGDELVADRYSYLPTLALFVLLGGAFLSLRRVSRTGVLRQACRPAVVAAAVGLVAACGWGARKIMPIWHDSLALWAHATERRPESHKAWANLGAALTDARRYTEAEHACREALKRRGDFGAAHYNLGVTLIRLDRRAEAAAALARAIRLEPTNARAHSNLGTVLIWLDRPAEALEKLKEALRLDPNSVPNARFQLGEAYRKLGRYEDAARSYETAMQANVDHAALLAGLADVYLSLGRIDEAEAVALRAVNTRPDLPIGRYAIAQVRSRQRRFTEALNQLRKALAKRQSFRARARTDPHLRELRLDPRFGRMMRRLPPTSRATSGPSAAR